MAFDLLDYDGAKSIDFKKFSLINTDNSKSIFQQIEEAEQAKVSRREKYEQQLLRDKYDQMMDLRGQQHKKGQKNLVDNKELLEVKKQLDGVVKKKPQSHLRYHKFVTR